MLKIFKIGAVSIISSKVLLLTWFLLGFFPKESISQENPEGWEKVKVKDGITFYTRHFDESRIKEFKAETTFNTSLSSLVGVFLDIPRYCEWVRDCKNSEVIMEVHTNELFYYLEVKVPFPFENRDMIQHVKIEQDPATKWVRVNLENAPQYIPNKKDITRMAVAGGYWLLKPVAPDQVQIMFQYQNDPGGGIPAWMVNMFIVESPMTTISNLRSQVKKAPYRQMALPWIEN